MCLRTSCLATLLVILITGSIASAQQGSDAPRSKDGSHNSADQNLKSIAQVNPSTLAMEMDVPLMSYPGRHGNSLPVGFKYSSKVWKMNAGIQWWYTVNTHTKYVTDITAAFAERTAAGWTSTLTPPRIEDKTVVYNYDGSPYKDFFDEPGLNSFWQNVVSSLETTGTNNMIACGSTCGGWVEVCIDGNCTGYSCTGGWTITSCDDGDPGDGGAPGPGVNVNSTQLYYVKRVEVTLADGSVHEFREGDAQINCGTINTGCATTTNGTYLSVDGSGMRLVRDGNGSTLYMPDGGKYFFSPGSFSSNLGHYATDYTDINGNKLSFSSSANSTTAQPTNKWIDTLGREIVDPMPYNWETQTQNASVNNFSLPGMDNQLPQSYTMKWSRLKPVGCETSIDPNCGTANGVVDGALEDQSQKLFYETRYYCHGNLADDLLVNPSNLADPANEVLFPQIENGIRPCNSFLLQKDSNNNYSHAPDGTAVTYPNRFNPAVLSEVVLPDGSKYEFRYNRFGEMTKIIYPSGSFETFVYDKIPPISGDFSSAFDQTNRGVKERRVFDSNGTLLQRWQYSVAYTPYPNISYKITTIAPKASNPLASGSKSERYLYTDLSSENNFGFTNVTAGMPFEERSYDENGALRSRTLNKWITKGTTGAPQRDARVSESVSFIFDPSSTTSALATFNTTEFDENGSTDPNNFSHLNVKRARSFHYADVPIATAQGNPDWATIENWFASKIASVSDTDYRYDYLPAGITSLPTETRSLNPANINDVLAKTDIFYDEPGQAYTLSDTSTTTGHVAPTGAYATLRGNATTTQVWIKETGGWLTTHTQYDNFGNAIKSWDVNGNTSTIQYDSANKYAYPTTITSIVPDDGTHGSSQAFTTSTNYDFNTGLVTSTTDANGLTTQTSYADPTTGALDPLLRVRRVTAPNGQQTITEYGAPGSNGHFPDTQRFVKVKTQFDTNVWKEGDTWFDSLGRTVKTQSVEASGDVFVETRYDNLGRAVMTTNPYRTGDPIFWSLTEFDAAGRVKQTRAPVVNQNPSSPIGDVLGTTGYAISTVQDYVGLVVTGMDAAGRRSRSITNALGQVLRVDEATGMGGINEDADLGSLASPAQPAVYKYNALGKMTQVTQGSQNRFFMYDSFGRLIRVRQPEQQINSSLNTSGNPGNDSWTSAFTYDALGNVKSTVDARGVRTITDYDNTSRVKTRCYTKPNQGTTATSCANLAAADTDPNTPTVDYYYDGIYYDASNAKQTATGAAKGALTQVKSVISRSQTTSFDAYGRPLTYQQTTDGQTYPTTYSYNLSGALQLETYPSGRTVKNDFNADGDLMRVSGRANRLVAEQTYASGFTYTAAGAVQRLQLGNGRWESAVFNDRLQITDLGVGTSATNPNLWKVHYDYGEIDQSGNLNAAQNTGNIAKQTISFDGLAQPFVQTYKYDALNRLANAIETSGVGGTQTWQQTFKYDRYGNRLRQDSSKQMGNTNSPFEAQTNLTFPVVDANTTTNKFATGQGYTYDANGNIIADPVDGGRGFVFNGDNKQTEVRDTYTNNLIAKYYYDGEGKRVKKELFSGGDNINPSEQTLFVYSDGKLVAEYSTTPTTDPTTSYVATDILQSVRAISNTNGDVIARRDFMPFGEELPAGVGGRTGDSGQKYSSSKDKTRQKFTGYEKDEETKLDFAEARYYNNQHGRFTAVDPLLASGKSANPQSFNRYTYGFNNPIVNSDPTGLQVGSHKGDVYYKKVGERWAFSDRPGKGYDRRYTERTRRVPGADGYEYTVFNGGWTQGRRIGDAQASLRTASASSTPTGNFVNTALINATASASEKHTRIAIGAGITAGVLGTGGGFALYAFGPTAAATGGILFEDAVVHPEHLQAAEEATQLLYRGTGHPNIMQVSESMRGKPVDEIPSGATNFLSSSDAYRHAFGNYINAAESNGVSVTMDKGSAALYGTHTIIYRVPNSVFERLPTGDPSLFERVFMYSVPEIYRTGEVIKH